MPEVNENDSELDGGARRIISILTGCAIFFGGGGSAFLVSPFVNQTAIAECREASDEAAETAQKALGISRDAQRLAVETRTRAIILEPRISRLESDVKDLPPAWLRREMDQYNKRLERLEEREP